MLINALCDYYDVLAEKNLVLPKGYSNVGIGYLISLTENGEIDGILDWQEAHEQKDKKGKVKTVYTDRQIRMPKRTEKSCVCSNIIEHRSLYIFGLNFEDGILDPNDKTGKAKKSHADFAEKNLEFLKDLDSPVVNAYRNFILNWKPENECENQYLINLGKAINTAKFAFCLSGRPDLLLHDDKSVKEKWEKSIIETAESEDGEVVSQCAVTGEMLPIARLHNKISGLPGGVAMGNILVCINNDSENSYGHQKSYNSNISVEAMEKYTEALQYLLTGKEHKTIVDDITVLYWATDDNENCNDLFSALVFGNEDKLDTNLTEKMLGSLMGRINDGNITYDEISDTDFIDENVNFYILGLKPNSSRIAMKFLYRKRFGDILLNVARHQADMQISAKMKTVPLWRIKKETISPKSKNETVNPDLFTKLFEAILYGNQYPVSLLSTMVRRVKTDKSVNDVRAGIIKACINRKSRINMQKEELNVALDKENNNQAYLCGRLFAVLEKLQQDASNNSLNRTIKDAYFASACSKPAIVFPKLMKLSMNHLNKVKNPTFYKINIGEITDKLCGTFPETLLLTDQGKFIIGYYQQYQSFFVKTVKNTENNENTMEE